ncbi:MAG: hypothetical protein NTX07_02100 [Solirubrobacterales bacterium]|nr:hypothetical protein [Solirubrobacterales bacterium]
MTKGRGAKVPRPTGKHEWTLRFANRQADAAWKELANSRVAHALAKFYDIAARDPRGSSDPGRHHRLRGELGTNVRSGRSLEQWQYEFTSGGRIWFVIDDDERTVWVALVSSGHPAKTDK